MITISSDILDQTQANKFLVTLDYTSIIKLSYKTQLRKQFNIPVDIGLKDVIAMRDLTINQGNVISTATSYKFHS